MSEGTASTAGVSGRTQIQALQQPAFRLVEIAQPIEVGVGDAKVDGANGLLGTVHDGLRQTERLEIGFDARRIVAFPLYLSEFMNARAERADGVALIGAALLGRRRPRRAGALAIPIDAEALQALRLVEIALRPREANPIFGDKTPLILASGKRPIGVRIDKIRRDRPNQPPPGGTASGLPV